MSLDSVIYDRLSSVAGVTAIIGSGSSARVYPMQAPQDAAMPFVVWQRIGADRERAMGNDPSLIRTRVQFDCFASTYDGARDLVVAVRGALERWSSAATSPVIQDVFVESEVDLNDDPTLVNAFRSAIDFEFIAQGD